MKAVVALLLAGLVAVQGCAQVYTSGDAHGAERSLLASADGCGYNHDMAGRDWPSFDYKCNWKCGGKSQSPINVPTAGNYQIDSKLKANLKFGTAKNLRVLNIGHAVQVEFDAPTDNTASVVVFGDSIYDVYRAKDPNAAKSYRRINVQPLQFHMHATSEHLLSGNSTELELHLVTKLVETPGVRLPKECRNGGLCLAVFGVFYDISTNPNEYDGSMLFNTIINNMPKCEEAGKLCVKKAAGSINLSALMPSTSYYAYTGSLTTPPCSEGVMWHVFPKVRTTLTQAQVLDLQLALSTAQYDGHKVANRLNNREVLPLLGRNVFFSP